MARTKKEIGEVEAQETDVEKEANHPEPRVYELGFHLDPELPQEEAKKAYQALKDLIASNGTVVAEGEPEKIQLAYTVSRMETGGRRDFNSAYFAWIAYEAAGEGHQVISNAAKSNSRIIRFLDVRTTKDGARHSAEMQEFYRQAAQENQAAALEEEAIVDTELDTALREAGVS